MIQFDWYKVQELAPANKLNNILGPLECAEDEISSYSRSLSLQ